MKRREFLVVTAAVPMAGAFAFAEAQQKRISGRSVFYAAVGEEVMQYDLDATGAALIRRASVTVPANVQEAWPHPSGKYLYVTWSNGGASYAAVNGAVPKGDKFGVSAFRIDPASGALSPHGTPAALPVRSVFVTTDIDGTHLISAFNEPSSLAVHRIMPDGTLGAEVKSKAPLDCGIYAHQVRVDPSNKAVLIPARGNGPTAARPEDPGSIKIFSYNKGMLENQQTVAPERGFGFQVRHLDFHPSGKWTFITLERQNQIHVYERKPDGTLSTSPVYVKDSITPKERQAVGTIHFHPNGKFLYVANRSSGTVEFEGKRVAAGGENNIAVFSINLESGEPTMIQSVDTRGFQPRCFSLDASGRFLVVANQSAMLVRSGNKVAEVPASLALFRVGADGKLEFVRKYDVATGPNRPLFWAGFVAVS